MRYFTHYWGGTTFEDAKEWDDGEALLSLGSNLFQKRGVTAGDVIYVINFFQGDLYVVGRLEWVEEGEEGGIVAHSCEKAR